MTTRSRSVFLPVGNVLVLIAAGVWLGTILSFGLSAAATFRTLRALHPTLTDPARPADAPGFADHPFDAGQPSFVAGSVVNALTVASLYPVSASAVVLIPVGLVLVRLGTGHHPWLRYSLAIVGLLIVPVVLGNDTAMARDRAAMDSRELTAPERADARADFDAKHKLSERLFGVLALTQLTLIVATAFAVAHPGPDAVAPNDDDDTHDPATHPPAKPSTPMP
ncbi:MAG: hypothetical protein AAGI54_03995 [Planctomycetota bacterium]